MNCDYFGVCGSCKLYELSYDEQIEKKKRFINELFTPLGVNNFEVFTSPDTHYRNRAEFRIWHDDNGMHYAMNQLSEKKVVLIDSCPKVVKKIADIMPKLKELIQEDEVLKSKLFSIEFLSSSTKVLVSMLYHKKIDESWDIHAKKLENELNISIIGRSRKVKRVISDDFVLDELVVDKKPYMYKIIEGGFSQPNSFLNAKMIEWATLHVKSPKDLLELYCGHGNFTIPFSKQFEKVLATEISKSSIKSAKKSCEMNDVINIEFLRMSVEELTSALKKEREFNRLKDIDLDVYNFSHVFVDPPRAGIDEKSLEFISQFENIIYISCNPVTLKRDLEFLKDKFVIENFAIFDQFPHTDHIESGIVLKKRN
ncbi:tRNA (uridine(54)-C5)-methyltransferase TrmA [Sulfurospirillum arcachonense]|uniref:tRNA (uridine(54)-C5)-methyltransferase TrmA n=1 Tax=Sulfurospirillum arcachonense TaxID=57666 RepID=UPI0004686840|nr:tRNA (uridine(54)-C5)-methyltransferase TrmA [Sulfurospirillum arcachonense]